MALHITSVGNKLQPLISGSNTEVLISSLLFWQTGNFSYIRDRTLSGKEDRVKILVCQCRTKLIAHTAKKER